MVSLGLVKARIDLTAHTNDTRLVSRSGCVYYKNQFLMADNFVMVTAILFYQHDKGFLLLTTVIMLNCPIYKTMAEFEEPSAIKNIARKS